MFGGADYGAGFWDLIAGGPGRWGQPRRVIERSIGPVWEANHVWLIFIFVVMWTSFPEAYASITLTLYVPLAIAALGIVLRGASFAFRKAVVVLRYRRMFGAAFASRRCWCRTAWGRSSAASHPARCPPAARPAIRSIAGSTRPRSSAASWPSRPRVPRGGLSGLGRPASRRRTWSILPPTGPDRRRRRRRPHGRGLIVLRSDASYVFDGLKTRGLPLVIPTVLCGAGALLLLVRGAARGARLLAMLAVAGRSPPGERPSGRTSSREPHRPRGAPSGTLQAVLVAVVAALIVGPGFVLLYLLHQRDLLPEEGVEDVGDTRRASPG